MVSGSLAHAGRAAHAAEAESLDAVLIEHYRKAQQAEELCGLLAGMGNSSGAAVVPVIEAALRSGDPECKKETIRQVRCARPVPRVHLSKQLPTPAHPEYAAGSQAARPKPFPPSASPPKSKR